MELDTDSDTMPWGGRAETESLDIQTLPHPLTNDGSFVQSPDAGHCKKTRIHERPKHLHHAACTDVGALTLLVPRPTLSDGSGNSSPDAIASGDETTSPALLES